MILDKTLELVAVNRLRPTLVGALVGQVVFLLLVLFPEGGDGSWGRHRVAVRRERRTMKDDWPSLSGGPHLIENKKRAVGKPMVHIYQCRI